MSYITEQLAQKIEDYYTTTFKTTGALNGVLCCLRENIGGDVEKVLTRFVEEKTSRNIVKDIKSIFKTSSEKIFEDEGLVSAFQTLRFVADSRFNNLPETVEDLRTPDNANFNRMVDDMEGVSKALAILFWNSGLKTEDLARDEHQLTKVGEGVVKVIGRYGSTKPRTVTSENMFGLTQEMVDEILPILRGKLFSSNSLGVDTLKHIGSNYTQQWDYTPSQLRAAHGIRLKSEGKSYAEIGEIQGVSGETIRKRNQKYENAN